MDASYYIKFIFSSLLVIGALLVVLKYSKKLQKTHLAKDIKIVDRLATGTQSNIFLINVKGSEYLIGATNQSIRLIDKL
tara:strand:- start:2202 stop:2438 length:237 start_codon:yes stop_codon:yes gene_type:complete